MNTIKPRLDQTRPHVSRNVQKPARLTLNCMSHFAKDYGRKGIARPLTLRI